MADRTVVYEFGEFRLDPVARVFTRQDQPIALPPKSFDLLMLLVERRGRVLRRDEVFRELWPDTIVEEANVTFQVSTLRKALGEDSSKWIETVPKHGYRFTAPVREIRRDDTREPEPLSIPSQPRVRFGPAWWRRGAAVLALVTLVAAFAVWYTIRPDAPAPREIRLEVVPLTTYTGTETEPALSPDGSQVAFTWDGENRDNHDIYVKAIGSAEPLKLTSDRARDGSPAWSPDGTQIAFLRDKPGGGSEVRLIPPTGGTDRLLSEIHGAANSGLSWSPDGRSLAVIDRLSPGENLGIVVLDVGSSAKRTLAAPPAIGTCCDSQPAFSRDGRTVAFNRTLLLSGPFVHVVSADGGEPSVVVPTRFPRGRLAWMPGGKEILFAAVPVAENGAQPRPAAAGRASPSLWRVAVDGGQPRILAGTDNALHVAVSGNRLVYSRQTMDLDNWRLDLRRTPAAGDAPTRFSPSTQPDANPQFSPDGERVAFTSDRSGERAIWVVDREGRRPLRLTSFEKGTTVGGAPRWSVDGERIAFNGGQPNSKNPDIFVVSATGGSARQVTTSPAIDGNPSWSTDGLWIYFISDRNGAWHVWKVPSSGEEAGNARQVTRGDGFGSAIESPNGKHVYFTRLTPGVDQQTSILRIPVEGGDEEVVVAPYRSSATSWDLTAEGVYYAEEESSPSGPSWVVRFQRFDRRHATQVARLQHPPFLGGPSISVSRDGRWLLATLTHEESDLMMVESFR